MRLPTIRPGQYAIIALALLVSIYLLHATAVAFTPSLRFIPGPSIARFTPLYRPWMIRKGDAPSFYRKLHQMYDSLVRTGPRTVDISDPNAVGVIYGISSKFLKVTPHPSPTSYMLCLACLSAKIHSSPASAMPSAPSTQEPQ